MKLLHDEWHENQEHKHDRGNRRRRPLMSRWSRESDHPSGMKCACIGKETGLIRQWEARQANQRLLSLPLPLLLVAPQTKPMTACWPLLLNSHLGTHFPFSKSWTRAHTCAAEPRHLCGLSIPTINCNCIRCYVLTSISFPGHCISRYTSGAMYNV